MTFLCNKSNKDKYSGGTRLKGSLTGCKMTIYLSKKKPRINAVFLN